MLYTDASDTCIGVVLTQRGEDENEKEVEKPVYFFVVVVVSHKLKSHSVQVVYH